MSPKPANLASEAKNDAASAEDERFRVLFEYSSDAHLVFDDTGLLDCNNAAIALLGCRDKAELLGLHPARLSPEIQPDGRRSEEKSVEMDSMARQRGYHRFEWMHRKVNGVDFPVEVTLTPVALRDGPAILVVWHDLTERRQMEDRLRESVARFDLMATGASMGIWETKLTPGNYDLTPEYPVYWSPGFMKLLGFEANEFPPVLGSWLARMHPDDLPLTIQALRAALEYGELYTLEYRLKTRDGGYRWFHATGAIGYDAQNRPDRFVGAIVDITKRKDAEEAQRTSAERFRQLSALAPVGIYLTDERGGCLFANDEWCRISGLGVLESIGNGWTNAIHPDDRESVFADWAAATVARTIFAREIRWLHKNGDVRWTSSRAVALRNEAGECTGFVGSNEDITDRKRTDAEIQRLRDNLDDAIESIDSGLVMFDENERLVLCNQKYRDMYGVSAAVARVDVTFEEMLRAAYAESPERYQGPLEGTTAERWIAERMAAFRRVESGNLQHLAGRWVRADERRTMRGGTVGLRTDVTDLVRKEERLTEALTAAEAGSKAKAEFLATMSHEIRTPMNGVIGMANLLVKTDLSPQQREFAETIRSCGEGLLTLINDILDFSKLEAGKIELEHRAFRPQQLVEEVLPIFASQAERNGVRLNVRWLTSVPTEVLGDQTRVRQILLNLLSNALKFTHEGSVELRVSSVAETRDKHLVVFEIKDTGIGMTPEHLSRIGHAFSQADASTTRRYGGTGLGLWICRALVGMMGGTLRVSSEQGQGSTFCVELAFDVPAAKSTELPAALSAPTDANVAPLQFGRMLVAEDNSVNQRLLSLLLRKHATEIVVVTNGLQAVGRFAEGSFDCVLMDCQMPELDGYEATRQIRAWELAHGKKRTPIIALTANARPGDRQLCIDAGMDDYLSKPLRSDDLLSVLERVMAQTN